MNKNLLYILTKKTYEKLYNNIENNLEKYEGTDDFSDYFADINSCYSITTYDQEQLLQINEISKNWIKGNDRKESNLEAEVAPIVFKSLNVLTPFWATEERMWCRLSHSECFEYAKNRWIKKDKHYQRSNQEKKIAHIKKHFFPDRLAGYRDDDALGRLWWPAKLISQFEGEEFTDQNLKDFIGAFFKNTDIRQAIMERELPKESKVFKRILLFFIKGRFQKSQEIQKLTKNLNKELSGLMIEALEDEELDALIEKSA